MKEVSVLVPRLIPIATLVPYLIELSRRGVKIHAYGPAEVLKALEQQLGAGVELVLHDWSSIVKRRKMQRLLHQFLVFCYAPLSFSAFYCRYVNGRIQELRGVKKVLMRVARYYPFKRSLGTINGAVAKCCGVFFRNPFATKVVISTTVSSDRHLLTSGGMVTVLLMESWDHPTKEPAGYMPDMIYAWNANLLERWLEYQGARSASVAYPMKMRYLFEAKKEHCSASSNVVWMYPATFCKNSESAYYIEECRLINAIARATRRLGVSLLVKPKPNGAPGEFDDAIAEYSHVSVGTYQKGRTGADYLLTAEYNDIRLRELSSVSLLINLGTTFAYEGAAYGLPVAQLKVSDSNEFSALYRIMSNEHLQEHLLHDDSVVFAFSSNDDLGVIANDLVASCVARTKAKELSKRLRAFIEPRLEAKNAIMDFADHIESCIVD